MRKIRGWFVTGLVVLLPTVVTAYVLYQLFWKLDRGLGRFFAEQVGFHVPGLGLLAVILLVLGVGALASNVIGRRLVDLGDALLDRIPIVRSVYKATRQISEAFLSEKAGIFREVVLVEFPRKGCYALGFVTSRARGEIQARTKEEVVNVFLPTTPNPTSGYLLIVPTEDIRPLSMSVEDGMKLVISGGSVVPPFHEDRAVSSDGSLSAGRRYADPPA